MIAIWIILTLGILIIVMGCVLSVMYTRRFPLTETRSPAEFGLAFEDIQFKNRRGRTLRGWWIPSQGSDRCVIILHGHGGSMDPDVHRAPYLHRAGFNVMLFDFQAHGRSEGKWVTIGPLEKEDVLSAVEFARAKGSKYIALWGFSMGGISAMLATPLTPAVKAVISDGGPTRHFTTVKMRAGEMGIKGWLGSVAAWLTLAVTSLRIGVNIFNHAPVDWVGKIAPRPILFIHGEKDKYCPDFDDLYAAAGEGKEAWRLENSGHCMASTDYPEEYYNRVVAFLQKALG